MPHRSDPTSGRDLPEGLYALPVGDGLATAQLDTERPFQKGDLTALLLRGRRDLLANFSEHRGASRSCEQCNLHGRGPIPHQEGLDLLPGFVHLKLQLHLLKGGDDKRPQIYPLDVVLVQIHLIDVEWPLVAVEHLVDLGPLLLIGRFLGDFLVVLGLLDRLLISGSHTAPSWFHCCPVEP